ncbi:hypothetical protein K0M31_003316 [Melipona bicolor]|uniref:Uncharacterized protein n=1 Tax=Melipona bicolor TaxID=60889 RepID=A0AA40KPC4_9HYME|nr:hypothetical protein K0M31_003316 [Melipona bicolor]
MKFKVRYARNFKRLSFLVQAIGTKEQERKVQIDRWKQVEEISEFIKKKKNPDQLKIGRWSGMEPEANKSCRPRSEITAEPSVVGMAQFRALG